MTKAKNWQTCGCEGCETLFSPGRATNIYCSATCQKRAYNAKHPGLAHRAPRRETWDNTRRAAREAAADAPTEFIGLDGEGITAQCEEVGCSCLLFAERPKRSKRAAPSDRCTCGHVKDKHVHTYVLLGCGEEQIENRNGLAWPEMFSFLYAQYRLHPRAAFAGYFLRYDFTQMLKTLPEDKAWKLVTKEGKTSRTCHSKKTGRDITYPVHLNDGQPGAPDSWQVEMLGDIQLRIRPYVCGCDQLHAHLRHTDGGKCPQRSVRYMYINDAGSFFQSSLLNTLNDLQACTEEEFKLLERGKESRGVAGLDEDMRMYNRLENKILAKLMAQLDEGYRALGIKLKTSEWYGPGAGFAAWCKIKNIIRRPELEKILPPEVRRAATAGYAGGWFEVFMHGLIPGTVYEYDIASAYPFIMSSLPDLEYGAWREHKGHIPARRSGQLRLVHCLAGSVIGSDPYIGAMLHRSSDSSMSRPHITGGWYWEHELEAARGAGVVDSYTVDHSWTFTPTGEHPSPLAEIADMYDKRLSVGKKTPLGKAIKLLMNSGYGKFCQGVGARPYGNMVYASLITAGCRCMILDLIASHPDGTEAAVMVATDAVYFTSPHPGVKPVEGAPALGSWVMTEKQNLFVMKPGVYWHDATRKDIAAGKTPGFKSRGINARAFAHQLADIERQMAKLGKTLARRGSGGRRSILVWPMVTFLISFSMVSVIQALRRKKWHTAGVVTSKSITQSADPKYKRTGAYFDKSVGAIRSRPYKHSQSLESAPYLPRYMGEGGPATGGSDDTDPDEDKLRDQYGPDGSADMQVKELLGI